MRKILLILLAICASVFSNRYVSAQTYTLIEAASSSDPYGCYDYIRAALEHPDYVNRSNGFPLPGILPYPGHPKFQTGLTTEIFNDRKYVYISNNYNYEVIVYVNTGHSVLKLTYGGYASKWNVPGGLYSQTVPNIYNNNLITETPKYMVYIGTPSPTAQVNLLIGQQQEFWVKSVYGLCYSWNYDANYFTLISGSSTSNSIILQAKCPTGPIWNSNQIVSVTVGCSDVVQKTYTFPVNINTSGCPVDPCLGTYTVSGSGTVYPLNTVNNVSNSPIVTTLNGGSGVTYTWTLTSGSPSSWYFYGTGNKNLSVALNKNSSASFRFTSSTCNRNITFYRGSTLMAAKSLDNLADSTITSSDTLIIPSDVIINYEKANQPETGQCNAVWVNQNTKKLIVKDNIEGVRSYKIISVQGILRKYGKVLSGNTEIDIQDIPSGIYIISIADCNYRFIKQ